MKKYLLLCTALTMSSSAYAALDCATPPTCDELGYTMSSSDCEGQYSLKCPFDNTKLFCKKDKTCEDEGYLSSVPSGKICTEITSNGKTCYDSNTCLASYYCGTGSVKAGDTVAYDSSSKPIAILYNNKYYQTSIISGTANYSTASSRIKSPYIMPVSSTTTSINKFTTSSYWTSTQCGSSQYISSKGCLDKSTSMDQTVGLLDCELSCPSGYSASNCIAPQYASNTQTTTSGATCYKCASCPDTQYPVNNTCTTCTPSCSATMGQVLANYPGAQAVVFKSGSTGESTGPCNDIGRTALGRMNVCSGSGVCFVCGATQ